jgi:hypothetical protein
MSKESVVLFRLKLRVKGRLRLDRIDLPELGKALKEMVGELKSRQQPKLPTPTGPKRNIQYPLQRNGKGRMVKPE